MTKLAALIEQVDALDTARRKAEHECSTKALVLAATILRTWKLDVTHFSITVDDQPGADGYHFDDAYMADGTIVDLDVEVPDYVEAELPEGYHYEGYTMQEWVQEVAIEYLHETTIWGAVDGMVWADFNTGYEGGIGHAKFDIDGLLKEKDA
jgi:hypothetical protein